MDHAPFIWTAYGASAVVLIWTALAPLLRSRRALANLRLASPTEHSHDADT
jgi:heme exporter protein CcmD